MTLPTDTEPSAEQTAQAIIAPWIGPLGLDDVQIRMLRVEIKGALDRFQAAERERCAAIADTDAQIGRDDMQDAALDKGKVGSRILAAERIAELIRSGASP